MPVLTWKRALTLALALLAACCIGYGAWVASWTIAGSGLVMLTMVVMLVAVGTYRRVGFGIQQVIEQRAALAQLAPEIAGLAQQIDANMRSAAIRDMRPLVLGAFREVQDATVDVAHGLDRMVAEISRIEHAIRAVDAKASALAGTVDQGGIAVGDLTEALGATRKAFDTRVSELGHALSGRLDDIGRLAETRLSSLEGLISDLDRRLVAFEQGSRELLEAHSERMEREVSTREGGLAKNVIGLLETQSERMERDVTRPIESLVKEIGGTRLRFDVLNDAIAMKRILEKFDLAAPAPLMSGWAIEPAAMEHLLELVCRDEPRLIVECGSGVSTVWLALAAKRYGGRVIALEHQHQYAEQTRQDLATHGLDAIAEVRDAPLEDVEVMGKMQRWYAAAAWKSLRDIDLLLVDGPPKATGLHARSPAVPLLFSAFAPHASIVVDDIHRREEREILALWNEHFPGRLGVPVQMGQRTVSLRWNVQATSP
ncbi:MAG: class I SAM-dependent methyltransferase [Luteimonas sp.]